MKVVASLVVVAACLMGFPAQADDAAMQAAATSTRAQWDVIVGRQHDRHQVAKVATPPVINSVAITTSNINVTALATPARISFNVSSQAGLSTVMVDVRSRDFHQGYRREIRMTYPRKSGTFVHETALFTNVNQPGSWDIRFIGVCDVLGQCTQQDFYGLDPVAGRAFTVTNTRTPDLSAPQVASAELITKSLTTNSTGTASVYLKFGLADTGTGAVGVSVCARPPAEAYEVCGWWELPAAVVNGIQWVTIPFEGNTHEVATWRIAVVEIVDRAGNQRFVNDPRELNAMFPDGRTFKLVNGS